MTQAVIVVVDHRPRCVSCKKLLGNYFGRPWSIRCERCKTVNEK